MYRYVSDDMHLQLPHAVGGRANKPSKRDIILTQTEVVYFVGAKIVADWIV